MGYCMDMKAREDRQGSGSDPAPAAAQPAPAADKSIYTCAMHPEVR